MRHTTLTGTLALPQTSRVSNGSVNDAMASLRDASPFRFTLNCFRIVHHTLSCEGFTALLRMGLYISALSRRRTVSRKHHIERFRCPAVATSLACERDQSGGTSMLEQWKLFRMVF